MGVVVFCFILVTGVRDILFGSACARDILYSPRGSGDILFHTCCRGQGYFIWICNDPGYFIIVPVGAVVFYFILAIGVGDILFGSAKARDILLHSPRGWYFILTGTRDILYL